MNRFITYMLFIMFAAGATAQVDVHGVVIDKNMGGSLTGASVIVKGIAPICSAHIQSTIHLREPQSATKP